MSAIAIRNPSVTLVDGAAVTTSQNVADVFGKQHDNLLQSIRNLKCSAEFRLLNFQETLVERANPSGGAPIHSPAYRLTRDGCAFLIMGFTGRKAAAFKEAYIAAFNRMEATLRDQAQSAVAPPVEAGISPAMQQRLRGYFEAGLQLFCGISPAAQELQQLRGTADHMKDELRKARLALEHAEAYAKQLATPPKPSRLPPELAEAMRRAVTGGQAVTHSSTAAAAIEEIEQLLELRKASND